MRILLGFVACTQGNQAGLRLAEEVPYRGLRKQRRRQTALSASILYGGSSGERRAARIQKA